MDDTMTNPFRVIASWFGRRKPPTPARLTLQTDPDYRAIRERQSELQAIVAMMEEQATVISRDPNKRGAYHDRERYRQHP